MESNKANLKAVKELVLDEHKLVTYISLSKDLCIHVNEAKSLLRELVQDIRNTHPETDLSVSYVVSGLLNNNSGCVTVCSETDVETLKKTLKIIFYEHVYCVSRGIKPVDSVALIAINKFEDLPLCTGLIKANSCSKRTELEIGNLISKNHALNIPKTSSVQQKPKEKIKDVKMLEESNSGSETKLASNVESKIPSPKKVTSNNHQTPTKVNGSKSNAKGIAGFFSKVNSDSTKAKKAKNLDTEIKVEKEIKVEPISNDTNRLTEKANINEVKPIKTEKSKANNKALNQIKKTAKVDKKRKRLLHVSDSESETEENDPFKSNEMDVNHESEDEIPPTPTINTVKITSGIVNPKKRRKIVDKTYTDEDGYILTKKEEVYESFSENEEEEKDNSNHIKKNGIQENGKPEKENEVEKNNLGKYEKHTKENNKQGKVTKSSPSPKKTKGKKLSPPKKGKQSSISSFFKKV